MLSISVSSGLLLPFSDDSLSMTLVCYLQNSNVSLERSAKYTKACIEQNSHLPNTSIVEHANHVLLGETEV